MDRKVERGSFRRGSGRGQALKMNWEVGRVKLQEKTEKCMCVFVCVCVCVCVGKGGGGSSKYRQANNTDKIRIKNYILSLKLLIFWA